MSPRIMIRPYKILLCVVMLRVMQRLLFVFVFYVPGGIRPQYAQHNKRQKTEGKTMRRLFVFYVHKRQGSNKPCFECSHNFCLAKVVGRFGIQQSLCGTYWGGRIPPPGLGFSKAYAPHTGGVCPQESPNYVCFAL